ncbi:MAG: hypothetical protein HY721_23040 [Planctomycetes bacterium]|nr:hypothetical protein [Planctomycetota bacterium]
MHESGIADKLIALARAEAARRGGRLRAVRVRLGALAEASAEQLRAALDHLRAEHGLDVAVDLRLDPGYPGGVEIESLEIEGG